MKTLCFVNGQIMSASEASIGVADLGLQRGYGAFDYARTVNGKLFHFKDHLARFRRSASELHLEPPLSDDEITHIAHRLIGESELERPALRLILTGGYATASPAFAHPNLVIIAEELATYPDEVYACGARLITVPYQRELAHIKSINYLNAIRLEPLKREKGAFDILYHSQCGITECPRSNFFLFLGDTLVTPRDNVLHGITRKLVLRLTRDLFPCQERAITLDELAAADEAFITSTSKGALPVVQIDDRNVGSGTVGTRTKTIMGLFADYIEHY